MTLGGCVVKGLLPRMMLLWRNAFPRNVKELESEKARGDGFTWKISLEARAGALASIHSFLQVCFFLKFYSILFVRALKFAKNLKLVPNLKDCHFPYIPKLLSSVVSVISLLTPQKPTKFYPIII